jgi:Carboxypeptidase regulatory-like domain/TonB dependent receptor
MFLNVAGAADDVGKVSRFEASLHFALILISLTFFPNALFAQTTATIVGKVSDQTGAIVSTGTVTAHNVDTGYERQALINDSGEYIVPSIPIGGYKIMVRSRGFKEFSQTGISLQVGQNARVDVTLQVGSVTESVNVSAAALAVDTESTTVGEVIDNRRIESIPLNGRNVLALIQLLPGVGTASLPTTVTFSRGGPTFNVSGGRANANSVDLDGTELLGAMGNVAQNLPSPDSLQEFRVLTNTYSADYGRASGGIILSVTKSGTNRPHGGLWEFLRNDALNARNYFNSTGPKPFLRQNQFGGSFGGPVMFPHYSGKDRTFFFVSYQGLRIGQQTNDVSTPLTGTELGGDFSGQAPIIDPNTGAQFPGNMIPADRLDTLAVNMAKMYLPLSPATNATVQQLYSQPVTSNQASVKIDQKLSKADNLSFRYYRVNDVASNVGGGDSLLLTKGASQQNTITSYAVNETHVFNPGLLNEANYSFTQTHSLFVASPNNKTAVDLGGQFGQQGPIPLAPSPTVNGRFSISPLFPLTEPDDFNQIGDKLSLIKGRHSLKFGALILHIHHFSTSQYEGSGFFTFDGSFTGNSAADYLIGRSTGLLQQSSLDDNSVTTNYQFFAQDDFKLGPRLTLNLGLRYELDTPPIQLENQTATIRPFVGCTVNSCQQSELFPTAPPGLVYPGDPGVPRGLIPADKTNFQPRFGFAFDPLGNGRTSIRGAYGIFYEYTGAIVSATVNQTLPYVLPLSLPSPPSFTNPFEGRIDPFPYSVDPDNPQFIYPTQAYSVDRHFKNGYVQGFNLNVQHQFGPDVLLQVGYYGKLGRRLSDDHEANAAVYAPGATIDNVQDRRPFFPQFYGSIGLITSDANSSYHSLQVSADKRFSHGYTVALAYTFSKSIDNRSGFSVDGVSGANPFDYLKGERGLSDFDQRHILAINGVWDLPFLTHDGWLTTALGGWQLTGTTRYGSGTPFNAVSGQDFTLEGTGRGTAPERPNQNGDPGLSGDRSTSAKVAKYFDTSVFSAPGPGQYGNSGRNNIIGPPYIQTDMAVLKRFQFPNDNWGHVQFRVEIFNLLNNVSFNTPNNTFVSPSFGSIQSAQAARIIQLGLRYDF